MNKITFKILSCLGSILLGFQVHASVDSLLVQELNQMAKLDQLAAAHAYPPPDFEYLSQEEWEAKKDSIFRSNQARASEILDQVGYPGFEKVGKRGAFMFWLVVQHADFDPGFQKRVLDSMYVKLAAKEANPRNYAYLTDRVNINMGAKQVYGTQVSYNLITGKARILPTLEPIELNLRRAEMDLEPIEVYLEEMTQFHMEHNAAFGGITKVGLILLVVTPIFMGIFFFFIQRRRKAG